MLYFPAVGQVKGFAFTLGLTTILDVVVVFLVTWPLIYLASKSPTMAKPAFNGLGAVQQIARERRAATVSTGRGNRWPTMNADTNKDLDTATEATEPESTAVEAVDTNCRSTTSSSASTPVPGPSRSSAGARCGTRSAA